MTRTIEFFAGLIGGIFALVASLLTIIFEYDSILDVTVPTWLGLLFSILAITGAMTLRSHGFISGLMLIIAGIGVFFTIPMFNLVSALLILISGFTGVMKMEPEQHT